MTTDGQTGKLDWIRTVLGRYEAPLLRYANRITGDVQRAQDVVQETFLRLWREEPENLDGRLAQWLFTVCRNQAVDVRRKEGRMTTLAATTPVEPAGKDPGPATLAERRETTGRILELLDSLPENQQEVIRLRFQNGLSYREISGVTGLSVSNVGFLIHRGVKTLRERMHRIES